jgi:two-component system nitrogen regulation sensor histidine kinase GlnL
LKDESLREYTNVIIEETDRLQNLMSRLLPSKKGIPFTPVNIHEVLERVEFLLTNEFPEIQIVCDFDPSLPEIQGDAEGLIQAVLNIARNAAQALEGKGEIILKSRVARNLVWNRRHHRLALELQIIDHGPGIPEELLEHVFYPLVSGKSEGSGLGLSIAQNVIERHEGSIIVESGKGRTCFTIDLPLKDKV